MATITCHGCGAQLRARGTPTSPTIPCPKCGTAIRIGPATAERVPAAPVGPDVSSPTRPVRADRGASPDDEPGSTPASRRPGKRNRKKRKKRPAGPDRRKLFLIGGGVAAGLVGLCVVGGVVAWLHSGRPAGDSRPDAGHPAEARRDAGVANAPVTVAPARAANGLSAPGLLSAASPPKVWKVTPDRVDPAAGVASVYTIGLPIGLLRAHGNQITVSPKILFARPDSWQAAVVVSSVASPVPVWLRYDLRKPPHPVAVINLGGSKERVLAYLHGGWWPADLSPTGTQLAVLGNALDEFGHQHSGVGVWSADGNLVMDISEKRPKHFLWAGFLDDNRLAVLTADRCFEIRDTRSGAVTSRQPVKWNLPLAFSPRRNWLVGYTGDGFEWRRMPGGEVGGTLSLPPGLPRGRSAPAVALSPDGAAFAAYFQAEGQHVILTWDVATGAVKQAALYSMRDAPAKALRIQWAGPQAVLIAGKYLVDLDLRLPVWGWAVTQWQYWDKSVPGPDWRFWRAGPLPNGDKLWDELAGKAPNPPKKEQPTFLFAASPLPPPVKEYANALRDGFVLNYNRPIRAEAQGANADFRAATADALAGFLTSNDFRWLGEPFAIRYTIDPAAPTAVRLRLPPPDIWLYGDPKYAGVDVVVNGQRRSGGGQVRPEVVVTGRMELIDKSGNVVWTSSREIVAHEPITPAYADMEVVRQKYPEAKINANAVPQVVVDVEAKYPELVAAARKRFLKELPGEVRQSYPTKTGMRPVLYFPAREKPTQPIATGEMTVDGLPPPPPPDRRPSRLPTD